MGWEIHKWCLTETTTCVVAKPLVIDKENSTRSLVGEKALVSFSECWWLKVFHFLGSRENIARDFGLSPLSDLGEHSLYFFFFISIRPISFQTVEPNELIVCCWLHLCKRMVFGHKIRIWNSVFQLGCGFLQ